MYSSVLWLVKIQEILVVLVANSLSQPYQSIWDSKGGQVFIPQNILTYFLLVTFCNVFEKKKILMLLERFWHWSFDLVFLCKFNQFRWKKHTTKWGMGATFTQIFGQFGSQKWAQTLPRFWPILVTDNLSLHLPHSYWCDLQNNAQILITSNFGQQEQFRV